MTAPRPVVMVALTVALLALPLGGSAQPAGKVPRIGVLWAIPAPVAPLMLVVLLFRRAGLVVAMILNGARPADLRIERPTKFELRVNLRTARALGLTITQSVLARTDEILQ